MKNLLKLSLLAILAMFMITGCEEDPIGGGSGGGGTTTPPDGSPTIFFLQDAGFLTTDTELESGAEFSVRIRATKGDADLLNFFVRQDGELLPDPDNRLSVDGVFGFNQFQVNADETEAFTFDIGITAHTEVGAQIYSFTVEDAAGLTNEIDIQITVTEPQETVPPTINITNAGGTALAGAGNVFTLPLEAIAGSAQLDQISVFQGDDLIAVDRLWLGEFGPDFQFTDNPMALIGEDRNSLMTNVLIRTQAEESVEVYTIALIDANGENFQTSISIDTRPEGNPVVTLVRQVLFNAAGPAGRGGIDLDTGASTGSSDVDAELKDEGSDFTVPTAENWLQRISGANDTQLKTLIPGQNGLDENFSFELINLDTEIEAAWANSGSLTAINANAEPISDRIEVGDMFIAQRAGVNYAIIIREVNVTAADNEDNYVIDIAF